MPFFYDSDAIHKNNPGEFTDLTEKTTLVNADLVLIEDSADSNNKKKVQLSNLLSGSNKWKQPVRVRSQGNLTLSAPGATIDGITMNVDDRVCCDQQSTTTQDGLYLWKGASTPMVRTNDAAVGASFGGSVFVVQEGTDSKIAFEITNLTGSDVIGTDNLIVRVFTGEPERISNLMSTGLLTGGILSINGGDNTKFDISAGTGYIVNNYTDPLNPIRTLVSWSAKTALTPTYLTSDAISYIYLDSSGNVLQSTSRYTEDQYEDYIALGALGHPNLTNLSYISIFVVPIFSVESSLRTFLDSFGAFCIDGNVIEANGTDLRIKRSAGTCFKFGANYAVTKKSPNIISNTASSPQANFYAYRNTSNVWVATSTAYNLDPNYYDPGGGAGRVAVTAGWWTVQTFFFLPDLNLVTCQYGQVQYADKATALAHIQDSFTLDPAFAAFIFRGYMAVVQGATNLGDAAQAVFQAAGKFGLASIITGSGGGEANTGSNIGTSGVGVYAQKSGVDIQFKNLKASSTKITVTDDPTPHTINLDVSEGNITHQNLSGAGTNTHANIDSHISSTSNPHSTTASQVGLGSVTNDAQLKRSANDFSSFTNKATLVGADVILVEDSAAAGVKKYSTVSGLVLTSSQVGLGNVTNDSQLKRAAGDFSSFSNKASPVGADVLLIEDSAAASAKKYVTISSLALTSSQVGLGNVTNDSQLKRSANDFSSFTIKATLVAADVILIEDSAAAGVKKYSTVSGLVITPTQAGLGNVTNDSQLKRSANDFSSFTNKSTLVAADVILVEDSAASGVKKYSTVGGLPFESTIAAGVSPQFFGWDKTWRIPAWPTNFISGLGITRTSASQLTIEIGSARSDDDTTNLALAATVTANLASAGAGGLDTGSEASSTWYYLWLIYNPTSDIYAAMWSLSSSSPTMPSGYTKKKRVGSWYNNSSSALRGAVQVEAVGNLRTYFYESELSTTIRVLNAGTATAFTDVNCSSFIPPTSRLGYFQMIHQCVGALSLLRMRPNGDTTNPPPVAQQAGSSTVGNSSTSSSYVWMRTDASQIIEYNVATGGTPAGYIYVYGYREFI